VNDKLTKCPDCNGVISKSAKVCIHCGKDIKSKKTGAFTKYVALPLAAFWLVGYCISISNRTSSAPTPMTPQSASLANAAEKSPGLVMLETLNKVKIDFDWKLGGFDNVLMLNAKITNNSQQHVKDLTILCRLSGKSGTAISKTKAVIYENIPAGKHISVKDFNMGIVSNQSSTAACAIDDLVIVGK
jgi:hypothetical protein